MIPHLYKTNSKAKPKVHESYCIYKWIENNGTYTALNKIEGLEINFVTFKAIMKIMKHESKKINLATGQRIGNMTRVKVNFNNFNPGANTTF